MTDPPLKFSIMLVDDEPYVISSLKRMFYEYDFEISAAHTGMEALQLMEKVRIDAAVIDLKMPEMNGLELLRAVRKKYPETLCIILTGHGGIKEAVESIKLGAIDFLQKPYEPEQLTEKILELNRMWHLQNSRSSANTTAGFDFHRLVGDAPVMLDLKKNILRASQSDANILILGETGTGKELIARAIHYYSSRRGQNFIPLDCAALTEALAESELFGHLKGAFTGAHLTTQGLIRAADQGTLFLDEIGDLPWAIQPKLLRVLQEREVRPLGSQKFYPVDIRLVAATHRDLKAQKEAGKFRADLYYRLNVITLFVPALRERREDIPLLAEHFLTKYKNSAIPHISSKTMEYLQEYDWPGNVRELENALYRALALSDQNLLNIQDFPEYIIESTCKDSGDSSIGNGTWSLAEKATIQNALAECEQNRKKAARILGISEATLYRKIKKYEIKS